MQYERDRVRSPDDHRAHRDRRYQGAPNLKNKVGIVGNGTDKFTQQGEEQAREIIRHILTAGWAAMVSGHSPVGGIDIWAEEEAAAMGIPLDLKIPEINQWDPPGGYGYKARNLDIAQDSAVTHVILADVYPDEYRGRRWEICYHHRDHDDPVVTAENHVKSGGCWTGRKADEAVWHIVRNYT